jgi:ABC-2 type transport system ATP-binding protein
MTAVSIRGLSKTYPRADQPALKNLNLTVPKGICTGILGPNGSGKTTLLEILQGLRRPDSGSVTVLGQNPQAPGTMKNNLRHRVGGVLQENGQWQRIRVTEALQLFASLYPNLDPRAAELVCDRLDLHPLKRHFIDRLSGGQKQRVFLALALIGDPELLFLDEPTTGLDPQSRQTFWNHLTELKREGRTIVLTTHYLEEAERLCDQVIILSKGSIRAQGTPEELQMTAAQRITGFAGSSLTETYLALLSEGT